MTPDQATHLGPDTGRPAITGVGFIDFVHRSRVVVGGVMFALCVGCVIVAGWCAVEGLAGAFGDAKTTPTSLTVGEGDPATKLGDANKVKDTKPWRVGMVAAVLAALGPAVVGAFLVGRVPDPDAARRRRTDRIVLLVGGLVFGMANALCGLILFGLWFSKLSDWVDAKEGSHKFGWWPVAALLQFLLGAGVTFLAALPARAEERNRPWVRRAVYAINFALSTSLLVIGLVLVNAVVAMNVKGKLDTSGTGFYTLTDKTKSYLTGLKKPIKAYVLNANLGGESKLVQDDIGRLVAGCRQVNPARFQVVELSPSGDPRLQELKEKYKSANLDALGVLLTSEQDPGRFEHVPLRQMASQNQRGKMVFNGESQLVTAMMALTEERSIVYYTRGSGEFALDRPTDPSAAALVRTAFRLQEELTAVQCEARPLLIDPFAPDPKVPDDAAAVMVLDPETTLPPATVAAIQKYVTTPRAGGKRGKLLVFAAAHNAPAGNTIVKTGLEPVLSELGVELIDRAVHVKSRDPNRSPDSVDVKPTPASVQARNPMALAATAGLTARSPRAVGPSRGGGRGTVTQAFMVAQNDEYIWLEKGLFDPPKKAWEEILAANDREDGRYLQERMVNGEISFTVAAVVADGGTEPKPVAAVFGFADGLGDDRAADGGRTARVFKAALAWLRERETPPDTGTREYVDYLPPKGVDNSRLFWVPLVGTLAAIALFGLGVWAVRRK